MLLPTPLINVADRLAAILMVLVDAISPIAINGSTPTFPKHTAETLFFRLSRLVCTLIRISTFGIRTPADPADPATLPDDPEPPEPPDPRGPLQTLPRRPGWLLAALPDLAPAIAADLTALLADPALAALLAADPTLHRTLRPIFRSLGLAEPTPCPPPEPEPEPEPPPQTDPIPTVDCPAPQHPSSPEPTAESSPSDPDPPASNRPDRPRASARPFHYDIVTIYMPHPRRNAPWCRHLFQPLLLGGIDQYYPA